MKTGISKLGSRALDKRYRASRALAQRRKELIHDLGSEDKISTQQHTLVELASTSKLLLGSIDAWLLSQPSLFQRNKTLLPVVLQRKTLADGLASYLNQLGLERKAKELQQWLYTRTTTITSHKPAQPRATMARRRSHNFLSSAVG